MDTKCSYFKEIYKKKDLFFYSLLGLCFAFMTFLMERYQVFDTYFVGRLEFAKPIYYSFVLFIVIFLYAVLFKHMKNKKINRLDSLLISLLVGSCFGVGLFIGLSNVSYVVIYALSLLLSIILLIQRNLYVSEESKGSSRDYYSFVTRKYDFAFIMILAFVLAYIAVYFIEVKSLLDQGIIYYLFGILFAFIFGVMIYTLIQKKKTKVNYLDAVLLFLTGLIFFLGVFRFAWYEVKEGTHFEGGYYLSHHLLLLLWGSSLALLILTREIRASFVSLHTSVAYKEKSAMNYYGSLFKHYHRSIPLFLGGSIAVLVNYIFYERKYIHGNFMKEVFDFSMDFPLRMPFFLFVTLIVIIFVIALIGLIKKGFLSKKVNLFDIAILAITFALFGSSMVFIYSPMTTIKGIFIFIPLALSIGLSIFRIFRVDYEEQEEIKDDEMEIKIKVKLDENGNGNIEEKDKEEINTQIENSQEVTNQKEIIKEEIQDDSSFKVISRSMQNKLVFLDEDQKAYYNELKNDILSYKVNERMTKRCETFRKNGLLIKFVVKGKTLRVHFALNPKDYDESKYHQKDYGEINLFKEVPFGMKIKNKLNLKRAKELVDILMTQKGIDKKKRYEEVDYRKDLNIDGLALLERMGLKDLYKENASLKDASRLPDEILNYIPIVYKDKPENEEVHNVYIDTALKYVDHEISFESLHKVNQLTLQEEVIHLKTREGLSKKIDVIVNSYDNDAAKLVIITGGTIKRIIYR